MGNKIYLNGKLVNRESATITVFDHGLLYGDGIFEGIRSYNRLVFKLKEHVDRLFESAKAIELKMPLTKEEVTKAIVETLKANNLRDAYIRLVITRGAGDLGLDPRKCKSSTIFIITDKIVLYPKEFYEKGLGVIIVKTRRNTRQALDPQIKSLNYLNNILAKIEAIKAGVEEAIMLNINGFVAECTGDNIFIVKNEVLSTPPSDAGVLRGITRQAVINLAQKNNIKTKEEMMKPEALYTAEECFLTGTAAEIIPVNKIDKETIGNGKPGKITKLLLDQFRKLTETDGIKY